MIRPCSVELAVAAARGSARARPSRRPSAGRGAGSRWRARTGARRGRSGRRRTGSSGGRPRRPARPAARRPGRAPAGDAGPGTPPRARAPRVSSSSCSGLDHRGLGEREDLDHHPLVGRVPRQRHRAGAELLLDRLLQRARCPRGRAARRPGSTRRRRPLVDHLVEQLVDPLGERRHLLLLQRDADHPGAGARLEEEGALPGLADGAGDEALGRVEARGSRACHHPRTPAGQPGPAPPPTAASVRPRRRRAALLGGGGVSQDRSPAWVLVASTNGRVGGVAHDRHRRRVDVDPLEQVEVHAERVGQHRLDHVAVADRDPDRAGPVLASNTHVGDLCGWCRRPRRRAAPASRRPPSAAVGGGAGPVRPRHRLAACP